MSDLAEKTRSGPAAEARERPADGAAVLRGAHRPDLIRDEVLAEIFLASARARPEHPCLIDGARVIAGGVHPSLTYAEVAARAAGLTPEHPRSDERRGGKECRSRWSPSH